MIQDTRKSPYEALIFNTHISFGQKILLLFGWHIQVRVCGPMVNWIVTREVSPGVDRESLA